MDRAKLIEFLNGIAIIVPHADEEAMQVNVVDPDEFSVYVTGEESGDEYYIDLNEFNPDEYTFYQLQQVEFPKE